MEDKFLPRLNDATRHVKAARQTNAQVVAKLAREGNLGALLKKVFPLERLMTHVPATPARPPVAPARNRPATDADPATPPPARLLLPPSQRRPDSTPVPSTR